ncbi:F-box/WD repeat-containing protein 10 [Mugil cephalus]|uniref:F-box/WD repeat-containing protein 10 n=1 Tax=Mugil cephalus TaxID=48193 RepID=UPI001FB6AFE2|nr:F-box/WD repeat-containing protein 10 [Mugil cephalus]
MKSVTVSKVASDCEFNFKSADGCLSMCGMCPSCVFGPTPPSSTQRLWRMADKFKRRFVVALILRCRKVQVLESIQSVLGVTSWTWFTYARSRSPTSPEDYPSRTPPHQALDGKPLGMDLNEIWRWFSSSPDWIKIRYLCRIFSLCDSELLRTALNLTSVLLVRQKQGFLEFNGSSHRIKQHVSDSEDPALMVVPGSSKSVSGVTQYRDIIGSLPVDLSKRILGLLEEHTLRRCKKVCRYWQHLAQETMEEMKFRRKFQDQISNMMQRCSRVNTISPIYANFVDVLVPVKDDENGDFNSNVQKVKQFDGAYAKMKTKTVRMEERNIYCGAHFIKVLLDKEDPHRVLDYKGGPLMALASKDRVAHLLYVASETRNVAVMKGHVGSIRAVLLCEDRGLLITASCDASIRCWNLKTDRCEMALYGHTGTINCLDVHGDRLVSGAKDCLVKVWSLQTGKHFEDCNFKHPSRVHCVKINETTVYSSCDRGLIKIWSLEKASLLRVIDAHKSSVKCLFCDEWHLLSGDANGKVLAWSTNCDAKQCLMTFNHPKEVKSLTLVYLRVVTGCLDGKIRVFHFLTGDCLKEITAETEAGRMLSLHFHEHSILVNTATGVKLYKFAQVFWDYADSKKGGREDVAAQDCSVSIGAEEAAQVPSPTRKIHNTMNPEGEKLFHQIRSLSTPTKCQTRARARRDNADQSLILSEKAATKRMRERGLHRPLTRDSILLRVNAIQKAQCMDEVGINMESNARLRDSWGPRAGQDPQPCPRGARRVTTCVPALKRVGGQNAQNTSHCRDVSTAPAAHRPIKELGSAAAGRQAEKCLPVRSLRNQGCCMEARTSLPRINLDTFRK